MSASKYMRIASELRYLITEGTYPPGSKIPPQLDLVKQYGVARETVRNAISLLIQEGLLVSSQGRGTVVRDTSPVALVYVPGKTSPVWTGKDEVTSATVEEADVDIITRLQLPAELTRVVYRVRHQSREGGQVVQIHEQWIPQRVAQAIQEATGTDLADVAHPPSKDLFALMTEAGTPPAWVTEIQQARMPRADENETLAMPPGTPVLVTYRVTVDASKTPLETSTLVGAGDRITSSFTVPVER